MLTVHSPALGALLLPSTRVSCLLPSPGPALPAPALTTPARAPLPPCSRDRGAQLRLRALRRPGRHRRRRLLRQQPHSRALQHPAQRTRRAGAAGVASRGLCFQVGPLWLQACAGWVSCCWRHATACRAWPAWGRRMPHGLPLCPMLAALPSPPFACPQPAGLPAVPAAAVGELPGLQPDRVPLLPVLRRLPRLRDASKAVSRAEAPAGRARTHQEWRAVVQRWARKPPCDGGLQVSLCAVPPPPPAPDIKGGRITSTEEGVSCMCRLRTAHCIILARSARAGASGVGRPPCAARPHLLGSRVGCAVPLRSVM